MSPALLQKPKETQLPLRKKDEQPNQPHLPVASKMPEFIKKALGLMSVAKNTSEPEPKQLRSISELASIPVNQEMTIGRNIYKVDISVGLKDRSVSGVHARVTKMTNGNYLIKDGAANNQPSTNGTKYLNKQNVWTPIPPQGIELKTGDRVSFGDNEIRLPGLKQGVEFDLTIQHRKQAAKHPGFEIKDEKMFYRNREVYQGFGPIDGKIHACVYPNGKERMIVFDREKDAFLEYDYRLLKSRIDSLNKASPEHELNMLKMVHEHVMESLKYTDNVDDLLRSKYQFPQGEKIPIGLYLKEEMGVCSHQALLVIAHVQRLKEDGILDGECYRNRCRTGLGAHAWARYESAQNGVYIIDPAQNVCERLRNITSNQWPYHKSTDIE